MRSNKTIKHIHIHRWVVSKHIVPTEWNLTMTTVLPPTSTAIITTAAAATAQPIRQKWFYSDYTFYDIYVDGKGFAYILYLLGFALEKMSTFRFFFHSLRFGSVGGGVKSFWSQCENFKMDKHKRRFICIRSISRWHKAKQTGLNTLRSTFFFLLFFRFNTFLLLVRMDFFYLALTHCECVPKYVRQMAKNQHSMQMPDSRFFLVRSIHGCDHHRYKL